MPNATDIGNRIKELRQIKGLTQQDLADAVGTTVSAIGNYESGQRVPKDSIKVPIARELGKSVEELFFDVQIHETCKR